MSSAIRLASLVSRVISCASCVLRMRVLPRTSSQVHDCVSWYSSDGPALGSIRKVFSSTVSVTGSAPRLAEYTPGFRIAGAASSDSAEEDVSESWRETSGWPSVSPSRCGVPSGSATPSESAGELRAKLVAVAWVGIDSAVRRLNACACEDWDGISRRGAGGDGDGTAAIRCPLPVERIRLRTCCVAASTS